MQTISLRLPDDLADLLDRGRPPPPKSDPGLEQMLRTPPGDVSHCYDLAADLAGKHRGFPRIWPPIRNTWMASASSGSSCSVGHRLASFLCSGSNSMRDFRKTKNMRHNPKVTLLAYDPQHPLRHIEIRGTVVEMTEEGALEHLDRLTQLYMKRPDAHFFGDSVPAALEADHHPVKIRIRPNRVRVEG